jgi:hypothetical protein
LEVMLRALVEELRLETWILQTFRLKRGNLFEVWFLLKKDLVFKDCLHRQLNKHRTIVRNSIKSKKQVPSLFTTSPPQ